ncbi:glycosyltransferase family 4 protein [candidate division WOR-3 bacterium]|nr:glycosyltransferase family 4 protein [candidate division WOR-3 bacterium]
MKKRLRIALDARRLNGLKRGVGQYVFQLACHLPQIAHEAEFLLLVDRPLGHSDVPAGCREVVVGRPFTTRSQSVSGVLPKIRSFFWMNTLVPRALVREGADLLHATNFAVPARIGCPCVVTIHDLIYARAPGAFEPLYENYLRLAVPAAVRSSRHVIAVSGATKEDLVELTGLRPGQVTVIPHGVGDEYRVRTGEELQCAKQRLGLPDRFILHVGAVERRKRIDALLDATAPLLKAGLIDSVVLAGEEGHGANEVRRAAVELGVKSQVRYLGYVPQELLPALYGLAQVLSLVSTYEGFGMPVLESMACGTPVITSNVSSLPEVAGDAAITVSPGDVQGLRRALARLLIDASLRDDLRRRGLARAREFSWESTAAGHLAVYRRVLETAGN